MGKETNGKKRNATDAPAKTSGKKPRRLLTWVLKALFVFFVSPLILLFLRPVFDWAKDILMWIIGSIFGGTGWALGLLVDNFYESALQSKKWDVEYMAARIFYIVVTVGLAAVTHYICTGKLGVKVLRERLCGMDVKRRLLVLRVGFVFICLLLLSALIDMGGWHWLDKLESTFEASMAIATPRISNQQDREFRARFRLVRTKADYDNLLKDINTADSQGKKEE